MITNLRLLLWLQVCVPAAQCRARAWLQLLRAAEGHDPFWAAISLRGAGAMTTIRTRLLGAGQSDVSGHGRSALPGRQVSVDWRRRHVAVVGGEGHKVAEGEGLQGVAAGLDVQNCGLQRRQHLHDCSTEVLMVEMVYLDDAASGGHIGQANVCASEHRMDTDKKFVCRPARRQGRWIALASMDQKAWVEHRGELLLHCNFSRCARQGMAARGRCIALDWLGCRSSILAGCAQLRAIWQAAQHSYKHSESNYRYQSKTERLIMLQGKHSPGSSASCTASTCTQRTDMLRSG